MADELIQPATPKNGGNDKTAANCSSGKHGSKPKKQLSPPQLGKGKKPDLLEHNGLNLREQYQSFFGCGLI